MKPRLNYDSADLLDANGYMIGALFVALLRCDSTVSLAMLKTIAIEEKTTCVKQVLVQNLPHQASNIKLHGQILAFVPAPCDLPQADAVNSEEASEVSAHGSSVPTGENASSDTRTPYSWVWNGSLVQVSLANKQSAPSAMSKGICKTLVVTLPSHLCEPVNPHIVNLQHCPSLPGAESQLHAAGLTWALGDDEVTVLVATLWDKVQKHKALSNLPHFRINDEFPYQNYQSKESF